MPIPRAFILTMLLTLVTAPAAPAAPAAAPRPLTLITPDTPLRTTSFDFTSDDGTRVFFSTDEAIAAQDLDSARDVYVRTGAATTLVSPGTAEQAATLQAITPDGTRAFFSTEESLVAADTDATEDIYARDATGALALVTPGPEPAYDILPSADGRRVVFGTEGSLVPEDTDTAYDAYERRDTGELRLLSTGGANIDAGPIAVNEDGTRVLFITREPLVGLDTDTAQDIYERRADGTLRLISTGGTNDDTDDVQTSADGTRVYFETKEAIPGTGDFDTATDIYERRPDNSLRLVTNGTSGTSFNGERILHVSDDGSRVLFGSLTGLVPEDTDGAKDLYQRLDDGSLRLVSTAGAGLPAELAGTARGQTGASDDGTVVFFVTDEAIPGTGDTDTTQDIYRRGADGAVQLVSGGTQTIIAEPNVGTADGGRVFFTTEEAIAPEDNDGMRDVYEGAPGVAPRLLSTGEDIGSQHAYIQGAARDGSRVFFVTGEALVGTGDHDTFRDVYQRAWSAPSFGAPTTVTGTPQAGSTLTCVVDLIADGATQTIAWERDGVAIPGAAQTTHVVTGADVGHTLACHVRASNVMGAAEQTSDAVAVPVPPAPAPAPAPVPAPAPAPFVPPAAAGSPPIATPLPAPAKPKKITRLRRLKGRKLTITRLLVTSTRKGSCTTKAKVKLRATVGTRRRTLQRTARVKRVSGRCEVTLRTTLPTGTTRVSVTITGKRLKTKRLTIRKSKS